MGMDQLRVIGLEVENIKRVRVVKLKPPASGIIEIAGRNRQGKTSLLDAIEMALAGGRTIPWAPIRAGQDQAVIRLDLGNDDGLQLKLTRRFTAEDGGQYTTDLRVENAEGFQPKGAQTLLNTILNGMSFDPERFLSADDKTQVDMLKALVPGFDFDAEATKRAEAFTARTDARRDQKRSQAAADGIDIPHGTPTEPVETGPILAELQAEGDRQRENTAAIERWQSNRRRIEHDRATAAMLRERAKALREEATRIEADADRVTAKADEEDAGAGEEPTRLVVDVAAIRARIHAAEETNRHVSRLQTKTAHAEASREAGASVRTLTEKIDAIDAAVVAAIASANLPVTGLTINDGRVMLRGVPFAQASTAEMIRASLAIGMAMNPRLRVMRIRNGALLDPDSWAIIEDAALDGGYQVWAETVAPHSSDAIIMEEGEAKNPT